MCVALHGVLLTRIQLLIKVFIYLYLTLAVCYLSFNACYSQETGPFWWRKRGGKTINLQVSDSKRLTSMYNFHCLLFLSVFIIFRDLICFRRRPMVTTKGDRPRVCCTFDKYYSIFFLKSHCCLNEWHCNSLLATFPFYLTAVNITVIKIQVDYFNAVIQTYFISN